MQQMHYEVFSEIRQLAQMGSYTAFGVRALHRSPDADPRELARVADITTDHSLASYLSRWFEERELDPLHLTDVVIDML